MKLQGITEEGMQKVAKTIKGKKEAQDSIYDRSVSEQVQDIIDDFRVMAGQIEKALEEFVEDPRKGEELVEVLDRIWDMELPGMSQTLEMVSDYVLAETTNLNL